jgi:hypothetical protein
VRLGIGADLSRAELTAGRLQLVQPAEAVLHPTCALLSLLLLPSFLSVVESEVPDSHRAVTPAITGS